MTSQLTTPPALLIKQHLTTAGQQLIEVTLNTPKSLNALNEDMIVGLLEHLPKWEADPQVMAIIMRGAGDRAFCAGGDIRQLYAAMAAGQEAKGQQFFDAEYTLDLMLHEMHTPVLVWGNGYVMGGGMGLLQGASIRIGTPSSRLAMPEVSIGLFPDVAASYFLRQLKDGLGLFLGLTGAMVNATDALDVGLLDVIVAEDDYARLLAQLQSLPLQQPSEQAQTIHQVVQHMTLAEGAPESDLADHRQALMQALGHENLVQVVEAISQLKGRSKWLDKAIGAMERGSPTSAHLCFRQFNSNVPSVKAALLQEYILGVNGTRKGEFQEGIRALLIDKDQKPQWRYSSVEQVPEAWINSFYSHENIINASFE
ncbi:MAG TPA: enoyl-CoA hydratase/isomerase family protein [Oceanospirillaceae bacterium]|jgi:enoyl-CoA hydratase/carnithine racemase|nr:enoyl-CoA hydratase/isomerase family protein [Oceanospirillaceae bacterium]